MRESRKTLLVLIILLFCTFLPTLAAVLHTPLISISAYGLLIPILVKKSSSSQEPHEERTK